eukprot:11552173-Alexandrium_andersonii.AAC.1
MKGGIARAHGKNPARHAANAIRRSLDGGWERDCAISEPRGPAEHLRSLEELGPGLANADGLAEEAMLRVLTVARH